MAESTNYTLQPAKYYRAKIDARTSTRLFTACWKQYRRYLDGAIDDPHCDDDVIGWLDSIAADKVNDSTSVFYLRG